MLQLVLLAMLGSKMNMEREYWIIFTIYAICFVLANYVLEG